MKYIIGASIGGLFGLGVPFAMEAENTLMIEHDESPRIEESQSPQDSPPVSIDNALILPDNTCGYINYESKDIKEQAKECLRVELPAIPAI